MGTKAYFLVTVAEEFLLGGCERAVRELEAMPEVIAVEPASGACDLFVQVDAPIRVILVANKILAKEWVKRLRILTVQPTRPHGRPRPVLTDLLQAGVPLATAKIAQIA